MCGVGDIDVARGAKASPKETIQVAKRPGPESVGLPYLRPKKEATGYLGIRSIIPTIIHSNLLQTPYMYCK